MKTVSKIFMYLFLALGVIACIAVLFGATHQWAMAVIAFTAAAMGKYDLKTMDKRFKSIRP